MDEKQWYVIANCERENADGEAKIVHSSELAQYGLKPLNEKADPCICFADGEEWEELQGHDWEQIEDGSLRCSNCGVNERGGLDRFYRAPEDTGMDEEARQQWLYEHGK